MARGSATAETSERKDVEGPADFESAIEASGYGLFNILALIVAMPVVMSTTFETTTVSYIMSSAECDLELSLLDKGILNAITYAGMITSAFAWGYIADTKGRKKILALGLLLDGVCVLGSSMSQNFITLLIFKYFGGFLICGAYAVLMTYIAELHGKNHRARSVMLINIFIPVSNIILPILALTILPRQVDISLIGLTFHSWQIFLAVCSLPSFIGGVLLLSFMPESPKFLMAGSRNQEALKIFAQIYALNKWKPKDSYPIQELKNESTESSTNKPPVEKSAKSIANVETNTHEHPKLSKTGDHKSISWKEGLMQMKPLLRKPLLGLSIQVFVATFLVLLGQNTFRLWLPQLFASITEFEQLPTNDGGDTSICTILEYSVNKTSAIAMQNATASRTCEVIITAESYTNNITVAAVGFAAYVLASLLVNYIGVKRLLISALLICGTSGLGLYFSTSSAITIALSAIYTSMGSISSTSILSSSIVLFPTSLRTMVLSLAMMCGRLSSVFGNILFPVFMSLGCIPPFLMVGLVMYLTCILSIFLPNNSKSALK